MIKKQSMIKKDLPPFPTAWARTAPFRAVREFVQMAGLRPLLHAEVKIAVHAAAELAEFDGPAMIVANHSSHMDTALILTTLPAKRRRRTVVAAATDYFFESWWRASGSAIAFNTFPLDRKSTSLGTPNELLADGWSVLLYPEGTRSPDGYMGRFRLGAAWLAVENQVPVIPVGLRGTYAAMPRGRSWPIPGRPRVSVRYGAPIVPRPGETARELAPRITAAVQRLVDEDASTWWQAELKAIESPVTDEAVPPVGSWRRVWQQTEVPTEGGKSPKPKIWRK